MSIGRGMDKEDEVHMYGGHHTIIQENGIMNAAAARMDLEIIILSEGGQGKTNIV